MVGQSFLAEETGTVVGLALALFNMGNETVFIMH
jgi:hypothetical protein